MQPEHVIESIAKVFEDMDPWLVGGAARHISGFPIDMKEPRDYDVIIPLPFHDDFHELLENKHFKKSSKVSSMGVNSDGVKLSFMNEVELDIWLDDIGVYLATVPTAYDGIAINLKTKAQLNTREFTYAMMLGENFLVTDRKTKIIHAETEKYAQHLERQGIRI